MRDLFDIEDAEVVPDALVLNQAKKDFKRPVYKKTKVVDVDSATDMMVSQASTPAVADPAVADKETEGKFYIYGQTWVVLQNRLLHAINNLTLNERRLILYLSPMVRADVERYPSKVERIFTVNALDFAEHYKINKTNVYRLLSDAADTILTKAFWFWDFEKNQKNPNRRGSSWLDNCVYRNAEGCIDIRLSSLVVEMLTVFDKHNPFTKYKRDWVVHLGRYGIDLFEIMMSTAYRREHSATHTVDYLREKFGCVEKYPLFSDFRRYVLDPAIKEIEQSAPYKIVYTPIKEGRIIKSVTFDFSYVGNKESVPEITDNSDDEAIRIEFKGIRVAIPDAIQVKMIKQYNHDIEAIEYSIRAANEYIDNSAAKGREITNLQGVYISSLQENWGKPLFEKEMNERREAEERRLAKKRAKEEAERKKREFEARLDAADKEFGQLPDNIKNIILDALEERLPSTSLKTKFNFMRTAGNETGVYLTKIPDFANYFIDIMEGNKSVSDQ